MTYTYEEATQVAARDLDDRAILAVGEAKYQEKQVKKAGKKGRQRAS